MTTVTKIIVAICVIGSGILEVAEHHTEAIWTMLAAIIIIILFEIALVIEKNTKR